MLAALAVALIVTGSVRRLGWFLGGAAPVLCLVIWFKVFVAPSDPLAGGMHLDLGRLPQVAIGFLKGIPFVPLGILALTAALLRFRPPSREYLVPLIAVAVVIAGDAAVVALASYDLPWLLSTALERMYLQVWPLFLLAIFVLLRRPEDFALEQTTAPAQRGVKRRR